METLLSLLAQARLDALMRMQNTRLFRKARAFIMDPAKGEFARKKQGMAARLVFEMAVVATEFLEFTEEPEAEVMRRCAHAAYMESTLFEGKPNHIGMLTQHNLIVAGIVIDAMKRAHDRTDAIDILETRIILDSRVPIYPSLYYGDLELLPRQQFVADLPAKFQALADAEEEAFIQQYGTEDMSRLSLDATILQSKLGNGEEMTVQRIALEVFGIEISEGERAATAASTARAIRACNVLIALRRAEPLPSRKTMTAIRMKYISPGTQLQSLMNLAARDGHLSRKTDAARVEDDTAAPK